MGASHATLSSSDDQDGMDLLQYAVEQRLYPGSGRMMHTFRLKHLTTDAVVVAKTMWVSQEHQELVRKQEEELLEIKKALQGQSHVAPFLFWHVGEYKAGAIRPVHMLRPHVYTTLSDRLASRPFLTHMEKLWIVHQMLGALQAMHDAGVVHGFLTTENIGLTSWNWVVLLDISSYKARTALPDDDPSEYLFFFQELNKQGTDMTTREKRCYLAPERFYTPSRGTPEQQSLTPTMDVFSAGCVTMETFLNGERALDLGDLMEYRRRGSVVPQKLNKIESSSLRAACRHMLHLDPIKRLSAKEYRDRLEVPDTFETVLTPLFERVTCEEVTPDARMAISASYYGKILRRTVSVHDKEGESYFHKILGPSMNQELENDSHDSANDDNSTQEVLSEIGNYPQDRLLAETEALLKKLESPTFEDDDDSLSVMPKSTDRLRVSKEELVSSASPEAASSLLIYLQLILSTVRNVHRPSSKLVGLQLLERLGTHSSDETKLQRIVPTSISLLHDQDPLVRASAVQVMTSTLFTIRAFSPSDSKIFPQYIFKRVAHLVSDPSLVVRVAFARCIASLADTAHRFLDISHAVRLYEAVGEDFTTEMSGKGEGSITAGVFPDDVANLLYDKGEARIARDSFGDANSSSKGHSRKSSTGNASVATPTFGHTLISSTYMSELAALHEILSRWVVHITTDQSDQSSPPKRSLLHDLARLCNFFGRDGVMAFILPQILAFLNDRRDWQLRAALFECLPSVCSIIGRAATEHFVLPCLETALVDAEDLVMSRALLCLSSLIEMGLLSRCVLVTPQTVLPPTGISGKPNRGLFEKYVPLLLYPSSSVRCSAVALVNASCRALAFPDGFVFLLPLLRPYLRFEPSSNHLTTPDGLERCLIAPWTRFKLNEELKQLSEQSRDNQLGTQWTSIDDDLRENQDTKATSIGGSHQRDQEDRSLPRPTFSEQKTNLVSSAGVTPSENTLNNHMIDYLTMLLRSRGTNAFGTDKADKADTAIEGSLKLAQHVKFPNQHSAGTTDVSIPSWYSSLHDLSDNDKLASESCAIRSVSSLSQAYGLAVIEDPSLVESRVSKDTVIVGQKPDKSPKEETVQPNFELDCMLRSTEAKTLQGASAGEWGSDTLVDATIADTALLVTKLNALKVPPLPPNLGVVNDIDRLTCMHGKDTGSDSGANEWRPRADTLIGSSSFANGHTGPVSRLATAPDDRYFVSASYDGTVRVWESRQAKDSDGILVSSVTYSGHSDGCEQRRPRINDVATLENTNSVASGASDGSLHVWRVDMVNTSDRSRVAGSSMIRKIDSEEGEIHSVSHFNTPSASIVTFATQGIVHSMDLRQPQEPFKLNHRADIGYLTSMALGGDRHWMITGTSRGFVALWDIRFQQTVKLWHHPSAFPVTRLATSFKALPKKWGGWSSSDTDRRPVMFVACGQNECGMFDAVSGSCRQSFRVIGHRATSLESSTDSDVNLKISSLREVNLSSSRKLFKLDDFSMTRPHLGAHGPSINALVGTVGGSDLSGLITGGDDRYIRYWDFSNAAKCFSVSGHPGVHHRPTYERVDADGQRLLLCRQAPGPRHNEIESSRIPRMVERGPARTENRHQDSVQDVKILNFPEKLLVSCSRDSTVKLWR